MIAGLFKSPQFENHRKIEPAIHVTTSGLVKDVFAQPWEDPFEAIRNLDSLLIDGEVEQKVRGKTLFVSCLVPSDYRPSMKEWRIRSRYAFTMAAFDAGFARVSPTRMRVLKIRGLGILPFEMFRVIREQPDSGGNEDYVVLVVSWVSSASLGATPLASLEDYRSQLAGRLGIEKESTAGHLILGPPSSDHLSRMVKEILSGSLDPKDFQNTRLFSPWATVSQNEILRKGGWDEYEKENRGDFSIKLEELNELYQEAGNGHFLTEEVDYLPTVFCLAGIQFSSAVGSDKLLIERAVEEIKLRVGPNKKRINLLVIGEITSQYGRFWASKGIWQEAEKIYVRAVVPYQRGIDASLFSTSNEVSPENNLSDPSGQHQADYLRRQLESHSLGSSFFPQSRMVDAIVISGSDVIDKLMLIQVLKPLFPGTLILTPDYDERLAEESAIPITKNLVIVSHFGARWEVGRVWHGMERCVENMEKGRWRDWAQESFYIAAIEGIAGAHSIPKSDILSLEIGNKGFLPYVGGGGSTRVDEVDEYPALLEIVFYAGVMILLASFFVMRRFSKPPKFLTKKGPAYRSKRYRRLILVVATVLSLGLWMQLFMTVKENHWAIDGEMWTLGGGISVWPTIMIRILTGLLLILVFVALVYRSLWLAHYYCFKKEECTKRRLLIRNWTRCGVVISIPMLYGKVLFSLRGMGAFPLMAARGDVARDWLTKGTILCVSVLAMVIVWMALDFLACRKEIHTTRVRLLKAISGLRLLTSEKTSANEAVIFRCKRLRGLVTNELSRLGDLSAGLTAFVAVPGTVFAIMVLVRANFFDNFAWNGWYIGTMAILPVGLLWPLWGLRLTADRTRRLLLRELHEIEGLALEQRSMAESLIWLTDYVRGFRRGCFCPWIDDPLVRVIMVPITILGSIGYLQSFSGFTF